MSIALENERAASVPAVLAPPETEVAKPSRRSWLVLFTVIGASVMDLLDSTITNVAGPSIRASLGASTSALQWIIAGYTLCFSVTLITGGRLGDVFGRRRMFLTGLVGFVVASVACSLAANAGMLIGTRVIQGAFAAVMVPQGVGLIRGAFRPQEIGKAFAIFGPCMGLSAMMGPVVAGLLIDNVGWRAIFLINVPLGVVALFGALRVLPADEAASADKPRLDPVGVLLASVGVLLLVFPLVQGREYGWPVWSFAMMGASVPMFALFAVYQGARRRSGRDPLIEPGLLRKRAFTGGLLTITLFFGAASGVFLIGTLLLQGALHFSPLHAGLTGLWWSVGTLLALGAGGAFVKKSPRAVLQVGLLVMAAGLVFCALTVHHYGAHLSTWTIGPAMMLSGLGMGLVFAPYFGILLAAVEDHEVGSASGVINSTNQLGGSIGVAALGTVFFDTAGGHGMFAAAERVYLAAAVALAVTWIVSFLVPKTARDENAVS
ncbi:MAG TPA: MFS transporter [Actinocrinis sp.]|jgi:EmrB/QacA subfamily drug resistance transporter|uniref:MFS transporter n=1 Tax=Actinocrinis sp. TaxID=1920516 RepID=UPI002DDCEA5F|nr:MFS transporter [Actinocrinis sp.]HEV3170868.1 MFS transporter [Actinocrinis sp.]